MKEIKHRKFKNGTVYALKTDDDYPIEVTDTFLPYYTKQGINHKNSLINCDLGNRTERWMIGVSCMSGCPVGCKFCATGQLKKWRNLTAKEIVDQVNFILHKNPDIEENESKEFKINYTRMGEPFLNLTEVKEAINTIDYFMDGNVHHYVSTIGLNDSDFSWIKNNITLQISLHSLDEERRQQLIPVNNLMSLKELGKIRTCSKLKTTLNLTLVDEKDFDIEKLKEFFDPKYFFIKLSPINKNSVSDGNNLGNGIIKGANLL